MLSPSLEDYLEEIYRFSVSHDIVRVTDISQKLNVKLPSVTKAAGKLRAGGYITYQKYGVIGLTDKGRPDRWVPCRKKYAFTGVSQDNLC